MAHNLIEGRYPLLRRRTKIRLILVLPLIPLLQLLATLWKLDSRENHASSSSPEYHRDDDVKLSLVNDIDFSTKALCGRHKCFFRSKANASVAYLIARNEKNTNTEDMFEQWRLMKHLEAEYKIRHFLLEPPKTMNITHEVAEKLNSISVRHRNPRNPKDDPSVDTLRYFSGSTPIILQESHVAPTPSIQMGCAPRKLLRAMGDISDTFMASIEREEFVAQLRRELAHTTAWLQKEPFVVPDFQFIVDSDGKIYNIDLGWFIVDKNGMAVDRNITDERTQEVWMKRCDRAFEKLLLKFSSR
ncbi:hypothetical protein ACHAWF_012697 [Thalassiosira exigua]